MAFAGTLFTRGRGRAVVVATGMSTEFGQISRLVQTVEAGRTPLQENLDRLGSSLGKAALVVVALIVVAGLWRGMPPLEMFLFGIALAVAVVPEALPAVVTISLALGVRRMVKRQALVRRLPVVETLGSTSVICTDKTGTLTRNEMTVRRLATFDGTFEVSGTGYDPVGAYLEDGAPVRLPAPGMEALRAAVLASHARVVQDERGHRVVEGDPTEGALIVAAAKAGLDQAELNATFPRQQEIARIGFSCFESCHLCPGYAVSHAGDQGAVTQSCHYDRPGTPACCRGSRHLADRFSGGQDDRPACNRE